MINYIKIYLYPSKYIYIQLNIFISKYMEFSKCVSHAFNIIKSNKSINTDYMHFSFALLRKNRWYEKVSYGYE
jgi:hypothetical protein